MTGVGYNPAMLNIQPNSVSVVVLGIMQDGGLPHMGCRCTRCSQAYEDPQKGEYVACLGIVDRRTEPAKMWLVDATPDIKYQLELLGEYIGPHPKQARRLRQPDGIFLTHAHMGHIAGLSQFGQAAMLVNQLKIFASQRLIALLKNKDLYANSHDFDFVTLENHQPVKLAHGLQITSISVPHRDENNSGTYAYLIKGPEKSLLYVPDIDQLKAWREVEEVISSVDYALLDATFFSGDEIGGRSPVAHPLVPHTIDLFSKLDTQLVLIHLNHTNPLLDEDSPELETVIAAGADIARTGQIFQL